MFGVNLFVPGRPDVDDDEVAAYVASLGPGAGEPRFDDDGWKPKLDVLRDSEPVPHLGVRPPELPSGLQYHHDQRCDQHPCGAVNHRSDAL